MSTSETRDCKATKRMEFPNEKWTLKPLAEYGRKRWASYIWKKKSAKK